jgi:hypothetical protein
MKMLDKFETLPPSKSFFDKITLVETEEGAA